MKKRSLLDKWRKRAWSTKLARDSLLAIKDALMEEGRTVGESQEIINDLKSQVDRAFDGLAMDLEKSLCDRCKEKISE